MCADVTLPNHPKEYEDAHSLYDGGAYKALLLLESPHSIFENRVTALGEANDFIFKFPREEHWLQLMEG